MSRYFTSANRWVLNYGTTTRLATTFRKKQMWWSKYSEYCFLRNSTQILNNFKKKRGEIWCCLCKFKKWQNKPWVLKKSHCFLKIHTECSIPNAYIIIQIVNLFKFFIPIHIYQKLIQIIIIGTNSILKQIYLMKAIFFSIFFYVCSDMCKKI